MDRLTLAALALALAACAAATTTPAPAPGLADPPTAPAAAIDAAEPLPPPPPIDPAPRQEVAVRYIAADDAWDVTWTFAAPADGVVFDRKQPAFRVARWEPGAGLTWVRIDGRDEALKPIDGVARTAFTARFPTEDVSLGRAPPVNLVWRDGGRLLFTGALGVHALACAARCGRRDVGTQRVWRFTTDDGRGLRVLGAAARGALTWDEPAGDLRGTYLYVGDRVAVEAGEVTLVVDGGAPGWLAAETTAALPALLARYAERTGLALPFRPLVLVSRGPGGGRRRAVRGRTLPALVQLEASGAWDRRTTAARRQWHELLAHEAFHLWNSQVARRADVRDEWWSEGASSYVAGLALVDRGLLDERRYRRRVLRAASACAATLRGPLRDEAAEDSYYTCGELLHLVVDRRVPGGVFPLYAALFAGARTRGSYTTADFLALLDPALAADLTPILDRGLGDAPLETVHALLTSAGLDVKLVPARGRRPARLR